jgi:alpha-amylase/alpha-mannosidase (GH57 family)
MSKVRLAFLWHMHQPLYREPVTGEYLLPWVRLHATRAYHDMAWMLERHPAIRCTVNFTPVLLEQLEDYVEGRAHDRWQELTARPAADLTLDQRVAILRSFFMVGWEQNVQPLPRYWEILQKRGRDLRHVDVARLARDFTPRELTDLQVLFNLAWCGFGALADDEGLRSLKEKGGDFDQADVEYVLGAQRRILAGILPRWRRLAERGQVELSSTPYFHPILPLLCDTDSALRALPGLSLPTRFSHPEDARWQVREAIARHARHFGAPPAGMWPAEGSVSPEALEVLAEEGIRWAASDEGVLLHSLDGGATRLRALYRPWRVAAGRGGDLRMLFRDRSLSDVIGFTYAKVPAREAAADFVANALTAGAAWAEAGIQGAATVGVFLDGENAWEYYPGSGHDFLDGLYRAIASTPDLETVTMSEATAGEDGPRIERIHSGSWIESSYRIWIGHREDMEAWTALGRARDAVAAAEEARTVPPEVLERARRHVYAAEGSDWFWWYGEDFSTELAVEFDSLFRGHVARAALLVGAPPPPEALEPIKRTGAAVDGDAKPLREPTVLISPRIDGRESTYFEWQGAGLYRPGQHRGSMYGGSQGFCALHFGFDVGSLYLRLDPAESPERTAEVATGIRLAFHGDPIVKVTLPVLADGQVHLGRLGEAAAGQVCFGQVLEAAVPFSALGLAPGARAAFTVHVLRGEVEVERLPRYGFVVFAVPDQDFDRIHWRV